MANFFQRLIGTTNQGEVDAQGQQRVIHYDALGNSLNPANRAAVSETAGGTLNSGKDYKIARTLRSDSTGALAVTGDETILASDSFGGTTRNLMQWVETAATMTSAQTLALGLQLNSGSSVTTAQGNLQTSHKQFPLIARGSLFFRARLRFQGATNCFEEWGFGAPTDATTAVINNGAFFRRDGAGTLQPILAMNGVEGAGASMTGPATTEYAWYEIYLKDDRALFQITSVTGVLISSQVMERGATGGSGVGVATAKRLFAVTHLPSFFRVYNSGAAGTAPQIDVSMHTVLLLDVGSTRDFRIQQAGLGLNSTVSPATFLQLANHVNSAAPTARALSNTAAAETTLGGRVKANSIVGAQTDLILFGWQNPAPTTFWFTGLRIAAPLNQVAAVATTATTFTYGVAFNSSAVSLATAAPYTPMVVPLGGVHHAAVAVAVNIQFTGAEIVFTPATPIPVFPGRFLHVTCREIVGTATAAETYEWAIPIDGFFE